MSIINVHTSKRFQLVDITAQVEKLVDSNTKAVVVYTPHTTCGIIINENEKGLVKDMEKYFKSLVPEGEYLHDQIDNNARSHILSSLLGPSVMIPVENGELLLGTWQSIFLVETDGPRNRKIVIKKL